MPFYLGKRGEDDLILFHSTMPFPKNKLTDICTRL